MFQLQSLVLWLLCIVPTASAYIFEFSVQLEGPRLSACGKRDFLMILHGIERALDDTCNEYLREAGYTGIVDRLTMFIKEERPTLADDRFIIGPYVGEAKCESCPKDDKDAFFFRRGLKDRLSKTDITSFVNDQLQDEVATIIQKRGSLDCAATSAEWKATFQWL